MNRARGLANGGVAEFDQYGMEGDGLDAPDAGPFDGAVFFGGEALADGAGFAIHFGQDGGVEVALVERCFTAPHYGGYDAGERFHAAHGADGVGVFPSYRADFEGEFGGGG